MTLIDCGMCCDLVTRKEFDKWFADYDVSSIYSGAAGRRPGTEACFFLFVCFADARAWDGVTRWGGNR